MGSSRGYQKMDDFIDDDDYDPFQEEEYSGMHVAVSPAAASASAGASQGADANTETKTNHEIIDKLLDIANKGTYEDFKKAMLGYFCETIPTIFMPVDNSRELLTPTFDEHKIQSLILEPIQNVLLGKKTNPEEFEEAITASDVPNGNCGKIFKTGESTYSCRDCGADPTCVLCNECFIVSIHRYHRYKIALSSGGGYCDCGDGEAWKDGVSCNNHISQDVDVNKCILSERSGKMAEWVIEVLLHYANAVLSNDFAVSLDSIPLLRGFVEKAKKDKNNQSYALILYNDEVHTFEIVIHTIQRVLEVDRKPAEAFTNKIHNEGRSILRSTGFEECSKLKDKITYFTRQTSTKPLRVQIQQSALVAHQHFAEFIVDWLTKLLIRSSSYRIKLNEVVLKDSENPCNSFLETLLSNDTKGWKNVREMWHRLLIHGLLKEYEIKKVFAMTFAEHYDELMTNFSLDDHDHTYSVTSLTVQMFTVPSLAHELIQRSIFCTIMRTILSEIEPRLQDDVWQTQSVVNFERTGPGFQFRRTHFALVDLKYLLTTRAPPTWTQYLRKEFVRGFESFTRFCSYLQESDPVIRLRLNHVERDPEWETAFNIQTKLAPVINLLGEWCKTDQACNRRFFRVVSRELGNLERVVQLETITLTVGNNTATCFDYDVSKLHVSIYLPLTRLYATIFLCIHKDSTPQDLKAMLKGVEVPSPQYLMEPPLRTLTLVAQRHAGMWTRNGLSLMNQIYFYQNVKCRADMLDKDLLSLQISATQMDPNEFVIRVLDKFNGMVWWTVLDGRDLPGDDEEDEYIHTVAMFDEFLLLIIALINGRYLPGVGKVTPDDCIRKQMIQALCIGPMTNSQLNRYLEEDLLGETGIERLVKSVAAIKSSTNGNLYELKREYYSHYDVFYYHYNRDEIHKAEEAQRARKLAAKEADLYPPPILPALHTQFSSIINLLKCDVMMRLMDSVIYRSTDNRNSFYSDNQLRRVLHLIGYGLNEELESKKAGSENIFEFSEALAKFEIPTSLCAAMVHPRVVPQKEMIEWVIRTYEQCRPTEGKILPVEKPVEADEDEVRRQRAAAAKARSMASMSNMQKKFRAVNADLFNESDPIETKKTEPTKALEPVCLGPTRTLVSAVTDDELTCILCMEKQVGAPLFTCCLIQRSAVLANYSEYEHWTLEPLTHDEQRAFTVRPDLLRGVFLGSCGHAMHQHCWKLHHANIVARERARSFRHMELIDVEQHESLCPMCQGLHNSLLPVFPPIKLALIDGQNNPAQINRDFETWLALVSYTIKNIKYSGTGSFELPSVENSNHRETLEMYWKGDNHLVKSYNEQNPLVLESTDFLMRVETESRLPTSVAVISSMDNSREIQKYHSALVGLWNSIAYTIMAYEMGGKFYDTPFFGEDVPSRTQLTMSYLTRFGGVVVNPKNTLQLTAAQVIAIRTAGLMLNTQNGVENPIELEGFDPFTLLVVATFSLPYLYAKPTGKARVKVPFPSKEMDVFIFRTVLFLHMSQLLRQWTITEEIYKQNKNVQTPETGFFEQYCRKIWAMPSSFVDWEEVIQKLENLLIPFVTCSCKFYECYTNIAPSHFEPINNDLHTMLKYLGQSTNLRDYFASPILLDVGYSYVRDDKSEQLKKYNIFPRTVRLLVELPDVYIDLINSAAKYECPSASLVTSETKHPTLCLLCGEMVCCQSACCVQQYEGTETGGCTYHAQLCGYGTGMFLRIRDCKAFLVSGLGKRVNQGSYVTPPYVDQFGETDQGLRRGNPLKLSEDWYDSLVRLWVTHGIPEEIVRVCEKNLSIPTAMNFTNWQHF